MGRNLFKAILEELNASTTDIRASVLMTRDGLALASSPNSESTAPRYDEDRVSALSASLLQLGRSLMDGVANGEMNQVMIRAEGGNMLATHRQDLALAVFTQPNAQAETIFPQMEAAVDSLRHCLPAGLATGF